MVQHCPLCRESFDNAALTFIHVMWKHPSGYVRLKRSTHNTDDPVVLLCRKMKNRVNGIFDSDDDVCILSTVVSDNDSPEPPPKLVSCENCNTNDILFDKIDVHYRSKNHKYIKAFRDNGLWLNSGESYDKNASKIYQFFDPNGSSSALTCLLCAKTVPNIVQLFKHQQQLEHLQKLLRQNLQIQAPVMFDCQICDVVLRGQEAYFQHSADEGHIRKKLATNSLATSSTASLSVGSSVNFAAENDMSTDSEKNGPSAATAAAALRADKNFVRQQQFAYYAQRIGNIMYRKEPVVEPSQILASSSPRVGFSNDSILTCAQFSPGASIASEK